MNQLSIWREDWDDADEEAIWHDRQGGQELGDRFLAAVRAQLPDILRHAGTHRFVCTQFSRVFAKPFPDAMCWRIHQDWVVVTLLWHTARDSSDLTTTLDERA